MFLPASLIGNATSSECAFVLGASLLFPFFRWLLDVWLLQPTARLLLYTPAMRAGGAVPDKLRAKASKLAESLWKLVMYLSFVSWGLYVAAGTAWFTDSRHFWIGWPHQQLGLGVRVLFGLQLAFYVSGIGMLALWEVRRKDFGVMMFHHVITVVLIACTYSYNYVRPGCIVLLLHDINDVLMEAAKSLRYCHSETAATTTFAAFTLSWAALRLGLFPFHVIRSTLFESKQIIGYIPPHYYTINAGLITLVCIHVWWFHLILRIVWDTLRRGVIDDVREDDSSDGD